MINIETASFATAGLPQDAVNHRDDQAGLFMRVAARLLSDRLDRQLAAGCPATAGALLDAHATRLGSLAARDDLADSMRRLLCRAFTKGPSGWPNCQVAQPKYASIAAAHETVRRSIALLIDRQRPINPRAIARLRILLTNGAGPLYHGGRGSLVKELHAIISLM
ncbi:MAG: hypothetical protein AB7G47_02815 [Mycolicibacterium sp.]|uniref:hypothetical protein n=1 Tax=Mycolicibacterium sp. TaxID=2320850 RepID=UPI003D11D976